MSNKLDSKMNRLHGRMDTLEEAMHNVIHRIAVIEVVVNYMIEKDPKLLEGFEEHHKKLAEAAAAENEGQSEDS